MKKTTSNLLKGIKNNTVKLTLLMISLNYQAEAKSICQNSTKQFTVETNRVWINVTNINGAFSQTLMGYREGASDGVDNLDGAYMNNGNIALASLINNARYAIQFKGLPFSVTDVVPLSFSASNSGNYTFAIDHMDGFFNNLNFHVYIHDIVTNTYNDLKSGSYSFTCDAGMYNNRFELTYSQTLNSLGNNQNIFTASNLAVYQKNDSVVVNAGTTLLESVAIYSMNGQLLYQNGQVNASMTTVNTISLSNQLIIIKVTTQEGTIVSKKWLYL